MQRMCIYNKTVCHDFTMNLSRKSRETNCLTISGYYPVNQLPNIQIYIRIVKIIDIPTNPSVCYTGDVRETSLRHE